MRCINIDWLEVYCLEPVEQYPMDAEWFRDHGYFVREREYGTRTYREMFTVEDSDGEPFVEIRRNPVSDLTQGLVRESCHLRLVNRHCYFPNPVNDMRDFLLINNYIYRKIYRIDLCLDFIKFDDGTLPQKFARRYVERKYRKINQCHLRTESEDSWSDFEWETLSWGSPSSMVSTKLYNKTKELGAEGKPYIKTVWFETGLVDNPQTLMTKDEDGKPVKRDVWRLEFSMKSKAAHWLTIEDSTRKRKKDMPTDIPHTLSLFDSRDKMMLRFEELVYHYFRFKHFEWIVGKDGEKKPKRKSLCADRVLFRFNQDRTFLQLQPTASAAKPNRESLILLRHLEEFRHYEVSTELRRAAGLIIDALKYRDMTRYATAFTQEAVAILQRAVALRQVDRSASITKLLEQAKQIIHDPEIF